MAEPRRDRPPPKKRRRDMTTEQLKNRAETMPDTPRARAELFELHGGICHITGRRIAAGEAWDREHIVMKEQFPAHRRHEADWWRNFAPALKEPHRGAGGKTSEDRGDLAKCDRVRMKHLGVWEPKTKSGYWNRYRQKNGVWIDKRTGQPAKFESRTRDINDE